MLRHIMLPKLLPSGVIRWMWVHGQAYGVYFGTGTSPSNGGRRRLVGTAGGASPSLAGQQVRSRDQNPYRAGIPRRHRRRIVLRRESAALLALVADADPSVPVMFLETGMLFDETLDYARELTEKLGLTDVRWLKASKERLEAEDPDRALWITDPDRCCECAR